MKGECEMTKKKHRRRRKNKKKLLLIFMIIFIIAGCAGAFAIISKKSVLKEKPEELIVKYMNHIEKMEYEDMYDMTEQSDVENDKEAFVERNSKIYEGIEVNNLKVQNVQIVEEKKDIVTVSYDTSFETVAGEVSFSNTANFIDTKEGYKLIWDDSLIFPELEKSDKVRVSTTQAARGEITDRNGRVLAGKGVASSVGIVPGKIENRDETFKQIAELLNIDTEVIEKKLEAKWVKEDSFVPIMTIPKVQELDLMRPEPDEEVLAEKERQEKLLRETLIN